jgi:hypothetical protein
VFSEGSVVFIALGVAFFLLTGLVAWTFRVTVLSGQMSRYAVPFHPRESDAVSFVGGCLWPDAGFMRATLPLIRLEIFDDGFRLGPTTRILAALIPTVLVPKEDVLVISTVEGSWLRSTRARIETSGGAVVEFFGPQLTSVYNAINHQWGERPVRQG